jgi:hypothetical protein
MHLLDKKLFLKMDIQGRALCICTWSTAVVYTASLSRVRNRRDIRMLLSMTNEAFKDTPNVVYSSL